MGIISEEKATAARSGFVYLMRAGHLHKIGRSKNAALRLPAVRGALMPKCIRGKKILLIHEIPCIDAVDAEYALHARFKGCRVEGEWFALSPDDVTWICHQTAETLAALATRARAHKPSSYPRRAVRSAPVAPIPDYFDEIIGAQQALIEATNALLSAKRTNEPVATELRAQIAQLRASNRLYAAVTNRLLADRRKKAQP